MATNQQQIHIHLTLVRHGETEGNRNRILQGQTDVGLNATGQEQARLAAEHLKDTTFDLVYSSDLKRAFETASAIVPEQGRIREEVLLRERSFGVMEGRSVKHFMQEAKANKQTILSYTPDGGESAGDVRKRAIDFLKRLTEDIFATENTDQIKVLVVSHGGILREMMSHLVEDRAAVMPENIMHSQYTELTPNTGISQFQIVLSKSEKEVKWLSVICQQLHLKAHLKGMALIHIFQDPEEDAANATTGSLDTCNVLTK